MLLGAPGCLRSYNGPEFIAIALQQWLRFRHCHTPDIKTGSPWGNPFIESFNDTLRVECLNRWLFGKGQEAQTIIEQLHPLLTKEHRIVSTSQGTTPPPIRVDTLTGGGFPL